MPRLSRNVSGFRSCLGLGPRSGRIVTKIRRSRTGCYSAVPGEGFVASPSIIARTGARRDWVSPMMISTATDITGMFLEFSRWTLLEQYWPRLRKSVESLTEEQMWWRPNQASNSIGNLLLNLNGNVRQWLVVSFNGLEHTRNRPAEFAERRVIVA